MSKPGSFSLSSYFCCSSSSSNVMAFSTAAAVDTICKQDYRKQATFSKVGPGKIQLETPWGTYTESSTSYSKAKEKAALSALTGLLSISHTSETMDQFMRGTMGSIFGEAFQLSDVASFGPVRYMRAVGAFGTIFYVAAPDAGTFAGLFRPFKAFCRRFPAGVPPPNPLLLTFPEQKSAFNLLSQSLYRHVIMPQFDRLDLPAASFYGERAVAEALVYLAAAVTLVLNECAVPDGLIR